MLKAIKIHFDEKIIGVEFILYQWAYISSLSVACLALKLHKFNHANLPVHKGQNTLKRVVAL